MNESTVLTVANVGATAIQDLLSRYELGLILHEARRSIPGSYWGDREAGITGHEIHARPDTPVHSVLHETCHVICMDSTRRAGLDRDAGGDDLEEAAVCYLQVLLADAIPGVGRERLMQDMDAWGYSFRLGSTAAWFENDATDAVEWLIGHGLVDLEHNPTWQLRKE